MTCSTCHGTRHVHYIADSGTWTVTPVPAGHRMAEPCEECHERDLAYDDACRAADPDVFDRVVLVLVVAARMRAVRKVINVHGEEVRRAS